MKKDDIIELTIEDLGIDGEGIGKVDGYTLFIKDAVIGDVVEAKVMKAKKNYGYARLMKIITPSKDRVTPVCTFARKCGGCQIQEMSYEQQLQFKHNKVRGNLERIGGFSPELQNPLHPCIRAHNRRTYRWQQSDPCPEFCVRYGRHHFSADRFQSGRVQCMPPIRSSVSLKRYENVFLTAFLK